MSMAPTTAFLRSGNSTTGRAKSGYSRLKRLFGVLGGTAPPVAAWVAERLFMTPPRVAAPAREQAALDKARRFHVPFGSGELTAWFWSGEAAQGGEGVAAPAAGATVLLVHGWGGRAGQLAPVAEHLVKGGFSVVAFDAPAHGESSGRVSNLVEFADAIQAVLAAYGPVAGTVAHSMGGAAAAIAIGRGAPLGRTVTIGAPTDLQAQTHRFAAAVGLTESVRARMQARIERRVGLPMSVLQIDAQPAPEQPFLVIHDRRDGEIPYEEGRHLAEVWHAELLTTDGLGHRRILRDPQVLSRISGFMTINEISARPVVLKNCATEGCGRLAATGSDAWEGWEGYCCTCALELDLRAARRRS